MNQAPTFQANRRYIFLAIIMALAIYVLVPQFGDFKASWHLLKNPDVELTWLALIFTFTSYLAATATYCLLAFKHLAYRRTLLVQLATMFINRLLPGGIGALSANFLYLRHERHSVAQATTMVTMNNLLGFSGHAIVVAASLYFFADQAKLPDGDNDILGWLIKFTAVTAILALSLLIIFGRAKFKRALKDLSKQFFSYRRRPFRLFGALSTSVILTLSNVFCLAACSAALGVDLPLVAIVIVFTFGIGAGTATPTPGGLGGFEAGLVAGFITYGIDGAPALAVALLYRLVSYWLPLAIGALAFTIAQRRQLFIV
jgi:glycosyltransferase 2 family protein